MSTVNAIVREAKFMVRDRAVLVWMLVVLCLSSLAVWSGLSEVRYQNAKIEYLREANQQERFAEISKLKDWGSAAYYSFHLTYDPPSDFAFAAMGQRDQLPWKHRIRMLALEGQIYEHDIGNPVLSLIGRFDFAFLAAFVLPLVLIMLLHDLVANERASGRHDLLASIAAGKALSLWFTRASLRAASILLCLCIPVLAAGLIAGTSTKTLISASIFVAVYTLFWTLICFWAAAWRKTSSVILVTLITLWLLLAVMLPAGARQWIDRIIPVSSGTEILMTQRETVNDAWDLPRDTTMDAFFEPHPEWSDYVSVESSFEWQWYYAFQQVGDQRTEPLSIAYRDGRLQRDSLAAKVSLLTPPSLLQRALQALAKTDLRSAIAYEEQVRDFHAELRGFYYPKFFRNEKFDQSALENLPVFRAE